MIDTDWLKVKTYFNKDENWGDPNKMKKDLLFLLYEWRKFHKIYFNVFSGYAEIGHSKKSYHYLGEAVDGELEKTSLIDSFLIASRYQNCETKKTRFTGIGCYYGVWKKNDRYINGLHLDIRTLNKGNVTTWGCLPKIDVKNQGKTYSFLIFCTYGYKNWNSFNTLKNQVYVPLDNRFFKLITLMENSYILDTFKI